MPDEVKLVPAPAPVLDEELVPAGALADRLGELAKSGARVHDVVREGGQYRLKIQRARR